MARGGYRPGAGRPKGSSTNKVDDSAEIVRGALKAGISPIEYMLTVMRNEDADQARRDRMAMAAAPYCHARADVEIEGKKQKRQATAEAASSEGKFAAPQGPKLAVDNT